MWLTIGRKKEGKRLNLVDTIQYNNFGYGISR